MNNTRLLLLVPLLISSVCLAGGIFLAIKGSRSHPTSILEKKYVDWHSESMKSEDPQKLKQHCQKLWEILKTTDDLAIGNFEAIVSGVSALIWVSAGNLIFCACAFYFSKVKAAEPSHPANPRNAGG